MIAQLEVNNLQRKIDAGSLPPDEPLFCLRAQDKLAAQLVREWALRAEHHGTPQAKVYEAMRLADAMDAWRTKQIPGLPSTRESKP